MIILRKHQEEFYNFLQEYGSVPVDGDDDNRHLHVWAVKALEAFYVHLGKKEKVREEVLEEIQEILREAKWKKRY